MPSVPEILKQRGAFRLKEARELGLHPEEIRRLVIRGQVVKLGRGLYSSTSAPPPSEHHTLAEIAKRVPDGIVCLLTALRFHNLGTQNPREVWLAVNRRSGLPRIDFVAIRILRFSGAALDTGIETHEIEGIEVRITSPARTVADCFRFRNRIGVDVAIEALRDYRQLKTGTYDELWQIADWLRISRVIRPYWDALSQ